jgi:putative transposase
MFGVMARKPRIHYSGAFYHVILRGNGGQDIFNSETARSRFYLLIQEGIERYGHRIHAFCLMTNHVHLLIEVGIVPLSRIMQNLSFRYTRYVNAVDKRTGHLFQGRYKGLLIDKDSYLLELTRYIHCNPIRAGLVTDPGKYRWSSHKAYLGQESIPWLTTESVLSQFAGQAKKALSLYLQFVEAGVREPHRRDFHAGSHEGRILGDDVFSEKALAQSDEEANCPISLAGVIEATCSIYNLKEVALVGPGKKQPAAEARAVAAYLVQEREGLSLTELGIFLRRDIAALSRAAGRLRERSWVEPKLRVRLGKIKLRIQQISKCQA